MSAPPAATGVPARSPVCAAASAVTAPTTVPGSATSGSTSGGRPQISAISADQVRRGRLNMPELDPHDGSVMCTRASRQTIQSLSMPRLCTRRSRSGRCRASQRSRAGEVIDTQSPAWAKIRSAAPSSISSAASRAARLSTFGQAHSSVPSAS